MPAPAAAAAVTVAAQTRTGRRIAAGALTLLFTLGALAITPLVAIPFAVAGASIAPGSDTTKITAAIGGEWGYPLAGPYSFGRGFGYNPVEGCGYCSTNHKGYDMAQGCGATIYAAGSGTVITAGAFYGWGNTVRIDHGNGTVTLYGHMQWGSLRVSTGAQVTAGTPLGGEGNTGNSFGCHLHFEVQQDGTPIDPVPFMTARGLPLT